MNIQCDGLSAPEALTRLLEYDDVKRVLDVGSGSGGHARIMREAGKSVETVSILPPADFVGDYNLMEMPGVWDAIWASHVLEHQENPGIFLQRCFEDLRLGGVLAVTVPPAKANIVGGHVSLWNSGLLLYHLILAGFDCAKARVSSCYPSVQGGVPYNLSVIVRKVPAEIPPLACDIGDIERLAHFFPLPVAQGFNGNLAAINW